MALSKEQQRAVLEEIAVQVPRDTETMERTDYVLRTVMKNGHEPNPQTAFKVALDAAQMGDVRTTAIALKHIPTSYELISIEQRGQLLLTAVRNYRDNALDTVGKEHPVFEVAQASMNALRNALGIENRRGSLTYDAHAGYGRRGITNGRVEPVPAVSFRR